MNLNEAIEVLEKYNIIDYDVIRKDLTYNYDQLQSYIFDLNEVAYKLTGFTIKSELSRRRALIVILQEKYFKFNSYNEVDINFDNVEKLSKQRFKQKNRDKIKFNSPQETHPKNPFRYYGDDMNSFRHYREAIELLACMPDLYIDGEEAGEDIVELYERLQV
ncbi:hypothetical protein SY27_05235 [Flavobacterium sp. 316]|uniref:hypothetical protein n=1 Tax=Flavobacterium sp. 316 TaxID=1603293 RepID=UPI0005E1D1FA|nr:hypothetical protein [Flavobacterium sp. 316]KIX22072.1 hypothetical protein SY27_05235 [Flavobacterium sp. 316]